MDIWDVGHSNQTEDNFLSLLKTYRIESVIDIRRFPSSKKFPHFDRHHLEKGLASNHIEYLWFGEKLGGYRKGGYAEWMKTREFEEGLKELEKRAASKRTAFMCAELDFRGCHRRFIIELLEKKGWKVIHMTPFSKKTQDSQTPSLFSDGDS